MENQQNTVETKISQKKPFYKKWWFITIAVIVVLLIIGSSGEDKNKKEAGQEKVEKSTEATGNENIQTGLQEQVKNPATENNQNIKETAQDNKVVEKQKGIGISYNQIMNYLSNFFTMKKTTQVDEQDRYMGQTDNGLAMLEIIGSKDNVAQVSLILGMPSDNSEVITTNSAIMLRFLKNTFPEWQGSSDWATTAIKKIASSSSEKEQKTYGEKNIEISTFEQLGMLIITVKHK